MKGLLLSLVAMACTLGAGLSARADFQLGPSSSLFGLSGAFKGKSEKPNRRTGHLIIVPNPEKPGTFTVVMMVDKVNGYIYYGFIQPGTNDARILLTGLGVEAGSRFLRPRREIAAYLRFTIKHGNEGYLEYVPQAENDGTHRRFHFDTRVDGVYLNPVVPIGKYKKNSTNFAEINGDGTARLRLTEGRHVETDNEYAFVNELTSIGTFRPSHVDQYATDEVVPQIAQIAVSYNDNGTTYLVLGRAMGSGATVITRMKRQ